ncbi:hypothetical protein QTG54_016552 [Skeletonema marinoi]|uniref:Uncharacterized protein n=1 Tax=Skeletonema marinoi TaxID=267567 RepID=A0AAD9D4J6_9STRA|nr:hypothetical protein QTG54_016552 [Skeletonema marinoi]
MADSLVFDFPDPTPHFDFDNFSNGGGSAGGLSYSSREGTTPASSSTPTTTSKKTSSKKSRALFKSRFMNKGNSNNNNSQQQQRPASPVPARSSQHIPNNGDDSPLNKSMGDQSGTTATTASMSVGSSNFSPNRLQYGNKHNHMIGRTASSGSPKSFSAKTPTAAVAPPPTSNNGRESPRFEFSLFDDPSPSPKSGMRKSLLSNKPNPYSNLTNTNLSTNTTSNHQRNHSGDGNNLYTAYGLSSDRTAASGYISEVSEFSFDRVTVTTERTGMSSNVSWNFMEGSQQLGGGVLGALGSNSNNGGGVSSKLQPPDIDKLLLDDDLLNGPNHHDSNGNRMNVFTGEIHERCDQSVISEISEGIDGHDDNGGGGMDFINSILMEKYEDGGDVVHHHQQQYQVQKGDGKGVGSVLQRRPSSPTQQQLASGNNNRSAAAAAVPTSTTPLRKQSSNNNNTISTVSTSGNNSGGGLSSVESAYGNYKQQQRTTTNTKKKTENRSLLKSIMEDIQFCGMYFCGLDTTVEDDGQLTDNKRDGSPSKKARAKEMDSTFLGKFVKCATCGPDS